VTPGRLRPSLGSAPPSRQRSNIWCGGSRLWGSASPSSDYDVYVVHRAKLPKLRVCNRSIRTPVRLDVTLVHADEWAERLRLHNPLWLVLCWHPLPWMLRLDPKGLGFELTPQVLANTMLAHQMREWARVRKCFAHASPDVAGGRTTLAHLLRTYALAIQLASRRRVDDFACGEPSRRELATYAESEWLAWRDKFEPRLEKLHDELRAAARRDEEGWRDAHREAPDALEEL
jgi:hypothetical protein